MKKLGSAVKKYIPVEVRIIMILSVIALAIHITAIFNRGFADFFSRYAGCYLRGALSYLTVWIPFSLAEMLLISLPLILAALIFYSISIKTDVRRRSNRLMFRMVGLCLAIYCVFVFGFGTGYYGSTVDKKLGVERADVTPEELADTAIFLEGRINEVLDEVNYSADGGSCSPYSLRQTGDLINQAYDSIYGKYEFISPLWSRVKPVILSEPMTYTHISGVYSYFTGEANINTNFPDYTTPYTVAHELAHQRGIAREDEANFVAYLACSASDDPYIRYSGYVSLYEYVIDALYSADKELYESVISPLDRRIKLEFNAYNKFFSKYRDSVAADISGTINDTYLKLQGTEGSRSYGLVVDLAVACRKAGILD